MYSLTVRTLSLIRSALTILICSLKNAQIISASTLISVHRCFVRWRTSLTKRLDDFGIAMQIAWDVAQDIVERLNSLTVGAQFTITEENGQEVFLLA
jgi:hypothetical protein